MNQTHTSPPPVLPEAVTRWAVVMLFCIAAVFCTINAFSTGNRLLLLGLVFAPVAVLLVNRVDWWFISIIAALNSWIYVPGFPKALSLFHLLAAGMIPILVVLRLRTQPQGERSRLLKTAVAGYLLVAGITAWRRGLGFRILGGQTWGGAAYVQLAIAGLLYLLSDRIVLSPRQWRIAIVLFFGSVVVPAFAEILFLVTGGAVTVQYTFIEPAWHALRNLLVMEGISGGMWRSEVAKYLALLFTLSLALYRFRGKYRLLIGGACAVAFLAAGISGYRSAVIYLLLLIPTFLFITTRRIPVRLLFSYAIGIGALLLFLHYGGRSLPLSFQRSFSWVPFADVSPAAARDAMGTTWWRLDLWKWIWSMAPDYWLLGRGFAFDSTALATAWSGPSGHIEWAIISHNYHSGPLSMLIDLGAAGFLFGCLILVGGVIAHYRRLSEPWPDARLLRYYQVVLASFCVEVFSFFVIQGDAATYMVAFLVRLTILGGLYRTNWTQRHEADEGA